MSISLAGRQGDRRSLDPRISADGRWVAFFSDARDLGARIGFGGWNSWTDRTIRIQQAQLHHAAGEIGTVE